MTPPIPPGPVLGVAIATLVTGGFTLESVERNPGFAMLLMTRHDEFGASQNYAFALPDSVSLTPTAIESARIVATHHNARLVAIASSAKDLPAVSWERFLNLFGGPITSHSPLDPEFGGHLVELGFNRLPAGFAGRADDLFEIHVRSALEFILAGKVIRYGQERLFESRPDGIAIPSGSFRALYDAKAYSDGYPISADGIRQFKAYVDDFSSRYQAYLPRLNAFIVVSSDFQQGTDALSARSREFIAVAGIPLSCMRASTLADIVRLAATFPAARRAVDWARIFADPVVDIGRVTEAFEAVQRDGIIPRRP